MHAFILALAMLATPVVAGDLTYRHGTLLVRLHLENDCTSAQIGSMLKDKGAESPPKSATVRISGRTLYACWAYDSDMDVLLIDREGTGGFFPREWFSEER